MKIFKAWQVTIVIVFHFTDDFRIELIRQFVLRSNRIESDISHNISVRNFIA